MSKFDLICSLEDGTNNQFEGKFVHRSVRNLVSLGDCS
jgi:hypothetical protein